MVKEDNLEKFSSSTFFIKKNTAEGIINALYNLHGKENNSKKQFPVVGSNGTIVKYVDNISFSNIDEDTANVLDLIKLSEPSVQKTSISQPSIVSGGQWYSLKNITPAEEITDQRKLGLDLELEVHPPIITYRTGNNSFLSTYSSTAVASETLSTSITLREGKISPKTVSLSSITFSSPIIEEESSTINLSIKDFTPKVTLEQGWVHADDNFSLLNAYDMTNGWSKSNGNFIYSTEIKNLTPFNIKKGVNILGVTGALNSVESTTVSGEVFRNALDSQKGNMTYNVNYATISVPAAPINENALGLTARSPLMLYLTGEDLIKRENFDCKTSSVSGELELKIKEEYIDNLNNNYSVNGAEVYNFPDYTPFSTSGWVNKTSIPLYFKPFFTSVKNGRKSFSISLNQIDEAFVSTNIISEITMFGVAGTAPNLLSENFKPATSINFNKLEGKFDFVMYPIKNNYEIIKTFSLNKIDIANAINEMSPEEKSDFLNMIQ